MAKLKVFRTPAGFHDAYVAASSQKAALQAWGADADLFARGIAEKVTDPKLTKEPLSKPGVVLKVSRGAAGDHFEAIEPKRQTGGKKSSPSKPTRKRERLQAEATPAPSKPKRRIPRPSRAKLDAAEQALDHAAAELKHNLREIEERKRALDMERRALQADSEKLTAKLEVARDRARKVYHARLDKWANR